ncbi:MAG: hypothetical protein JW881_11800 [Spirochaetales bacterium]|nr:hypothetical protein [Spirochaetales bacterium]
MAEDSNTSNDSANNNIVIEIAYNDFINKKRELATGNEYEIILKIEEFHYSM